MTATLLVLLLLWLQVCQQPVQRPGQVALRGLCCQLGVGGGWLVNRSCRWQHKGWRGRGKEGGGEGGEGGAAGAGGTGRGKQSAGGLQWVETRSNQRTRCKSV